MSCSVEGYWKWLLFCYCTSLSDLGCIGSLVGKSSGWTGGTVIISRFHCNVYHNKQWFFRLFSHTIFTQSLPFILLSSTIVPFFASNDAWMDNNGKKSLRNDLKARGEKQIPSHHYFLFSSHFFNSCRIWFIRRRPPVRSEFTWQMNPHNI